MTSGSVQVRAAGSPTTAGTPRRRHFSRLVAAAMRRDFAQDLSYRLPFVLNTSSTLFNLALVFGIGRLVTEGGSQGASFNYFAYAVLGLVLIRIAQSALSGQALKLRAEQTTGTLEALLAGPAPAWQVLLAGSMYGLVQAAIASLLTLVLAIAIFGLRIHADAAEIGVAVGAFVASVGFVLAIGFGLAAFTLVFKQATALLGSILAGLSVLSGVYFPLRVLPSAVQTLGNVVPFTWGLDVVRSALLSHQTRPGLLGELAAVDVVALVLGAWLIGWAVRRARRTGGLGLY